MRKVVRNLFISSPLWQGFLFFGSAAGFVLSGLFIIVWTLPSLFGSVAASPVTGTGAITFFFVAMAVGQFLGVLWGLSSSMGSIVTGLVARRLARSFGSRVVVVACGAAIGAVAFGLLVVAPFTGWNPIALCAPVATLAAGGFGALTALRERSGSNLQTVIEAPRND